MREGSGKQRNPQKIKKFGKNTRKKSGGEKGMHSKDNELLCRGQRRATKKEESEPLRGRGKKRRKRKAKENKISKNGFTL